MNESDFSEIAMQLVKDFQTGFGYYTLLYFALRFINKGKERLREFDWSATIAICCGSAFFLVVWIFSMIYAWSISNESRMSFYHRATGPYAFAYWLQPFLYTLLPQLLWFRKVRENFLSRSLIAFFLFFNFEKYVIIATSLHRDYLPSSWSMDVDSYMPYMIIGILWKLGIFTAAAAILFSMRKKKDTFAP